MRMNSGHSSRPYGKRFKFGRLKTALHQL
ncbi:hypothetical protein LEMLEM_LOCUS22305 [Lemmus lemmus]